MHIDEYIAYIISLYADIYQLGKLIRLTHNFYKVINKMEYFNSSKTFYQKHKTIMNKTHFVNCCYDNNLYGVKLFQKYASIYDYDSALQWACYANNIDVVKLLLRNRIDTLDIKSKREYIYNLFITGCKKHNLNVLKYLREHDLISDFNAVKRYSYFICFNNNCDKTKQLDTLIWLLETFNIYILDHIIKVGSYDFFISAFSKNKPDQNEINNLFDRACYYKLIEHIKFLAPLINEKQKYFEDIYSTKNIELISWYYEKFNVVIEPRLLIKSCWINDIDTLKWSYDRIDKSLITNDVIQESLHHSCRNNCRDIIMFLYNIDEDVNINMYFVQSCKADIELVKFFSKRLVYDDELINAGFESAIDYNKLTIAQWIYENYHPTIDLSTIYIPSHKMNDTHKWLYSLLTKEY